MTDYYNIIHQQIGQGQACFELSLNPSCQVYKGHFPTRPIAPGACSLEMIRQCACLALGRTVRFTSIKQCKFLLPLEPSIHKNLTLNLTWDEQSLVAVMTYGEQVVIKLRV